MKYSLFIILFGWFVVFGQCNRLGSLLDTFPHLRHLHQQHHHRVHGNIQSQDSNRRALIDTSVRTSIGANVYQDRYTPPSAKVEEQPKFIAHASNEHYDRSVDDDNNNGTNHYVSALISTTEEVKRTVPLATTDTRGHYPRDNAALISTVRDDDDDNVNDHNVRHRSAAAGVGNNHFRPSSRSDPTNAEFGRLIQDIFKDDDMLFFDQQRPTPNQRRFLLPTGMMEEERVAPRFAPITSTAYHHQQQRQQQRRQQPRRSSGNEFSFNKFFEDLESQFH